VSEKCCACGKEFKNDEEVVTFYLERAKVGEKSGALGFYQHQSYPKDCIDRVHFSYTCLEKCFSPADNPFLYDSIAIKLRADITDDIRQEIYDEINIELEDDMPLIDLADPPFCLWCKRTDTVWIQVRNGACVYACPPCNKYWNEDEDELTQDGQIAA